MSKSVQNLMNLLNHTKLLDFSSLHKRVGFPSQILEKPQMPGSKAYRRVAEKSEMDPDLFGSSASKTHVQDAKLKFFPVQREKFSQIKSLLNPKIERNDQTSKRMQAEEEERLDIGRRELEEEIARGKEIDEEMEAEEREKKERILENARRLREEDWDPVKMMRRKVIYAQCAMIREKQIEEKRRLAEDESLRKQKQELEIEMKRLQEIESHEAAEVERRKKAEKDFKILQAQIEERKVRKLIDDELREREKELMKQKIEAEAREEEEKRARKLVEGKELLVKVLAANEEAIAKKVELKMKDKEEDERILTWQLEKKKQEEAHEAEKIRLQKQRDKEFYEIAAKMKRSNDNRAEIDALRAKRHQQEQMKKDRLRREAEEKKKQDLMRDVMKARVMQQKYKEDQVKLLSIQDKTEWLRITEEKDEAERAIRLEEELHRSNNRAHQKELKKQVVEREKKMKAKVEARFKEGEKIRQENEKYLNNLKRKKREILSEMRQLEVPDKFCADLSRLKICL